MTHRIPQRVGSSSAALGACLWLMLGMGAAACGSSSEKSNPSNQAGATSGPEGTGAAPATGGALTTDGAPATGGVLSTGGTPATGGTRATGGAATGGTATGGTATGGAATGGSGEPEPTSGCGTPKPATAPTTITVADTAREFIVDVPAAYDENTPFPLVFGLHGMGSDGEMFRSRGYGNLGSTMGTEYILVFPTALASAEDQTTRWDLTGDLDFFDALLALMKSTYCIDAQRVFVTGHSMGAVMTNTLGCKRGDVVRAIAPMSGGGPSMGGFDPGCVGQVAAWISHGNEDTTVEISMGEGSRDYWAEANHCDINTTTTPSASYSCVEYGGCDADFPVRWCVYDGGHELPKFAQQAIYDFFSLFK